MAQTAPPFVPLNRSKPRGGIVCSLPMNRGTLDDWNRRIPGSLPVILPLPEGEGGGEVAFIKRFITPDGTIFAFESPGGRCYNQNMKRKRPPVEKATSGTVLGAKLRAECNQLSDAEREKLGGEFLKLMSHIPMGVCGRVTNAEHPNMMIRVEDDSLNTGGFLIYQWWDGSNGPNQYGAFDDWVESLALLENFFAHKGWSVEWATGPEGCGRVE
jgi:hypothetical protein